MRVLSNRAKGMVLRAALMPSISDCSGASSGLRPSNAVADIVKMPYEIHEEIAVSTGPLKNWITHTDIKEALILAEEVDAVVLNEVLAQGYAQDLTDSELEKIGRDPFLISYARIAADRIVVTKEVSRPSAQRANRQVPDVCNAFGVQCVTDFDFFKAAGFDALSGGQSPLTSRSFTKSGGRLC